MNRIGSIKEKKAVVKLEDLRDNLLKAPKANENYTYADGVLDMYNAIMKVPASSRKGKKE